MGTRRTGYQRVIGIVIDQPPGVGLGGRLAYTDLAIGKAELTTPKTSEFPKPQVREGRQEQQCTVSLRDVVEQLDEHRHGTTGRSSECSCPAPLIRQGFRRILPSSTASGHDGPQQPVCLGDDHWPEGAFLLGTGLKPFLAPPPYVAFPDIDQVDVREGGLEMISAGPGTVPRCGLRTLSLIQVSA